MEIVFTELLLFGGMKKGMKKATRKGRVTVCFRKIQRFYSCHSSQFLIPNSHGFFNTKIFYCDFFGWFNWLVMVVYSNWIVPSTATLRSQHIPRNRLFYERKGQTRGSVKLEIRQRLVHGCVYARKCSFERVCFLTHVSVRGQKCDSGNPAD